MKRRHSGDKQDGDKRLKSNSSTSDLKESSIDVNKALLKAVKLDLAADVAYWLDRGANVHGEGGRKHKLPMFVASSCNSAQAMRVLLQYGAGTDQQCQNKQTPLIQASLRDSVDVVQLLLERHCDVNYAEPWGSTALMHACEWSNKAVVKLLLSYNADIHAKNKHGTTALLYATRMNQVGIMQLLVDHGADIHHADDIGNSTALFVSSLHNATDAARWLVEHGADVNEINKRGWTPLFLACSYGCEEVVKVLLELGATVHHKDDQSETPLHVTRGAKVAKLLIQHGADVNHTNAKGRSVAMSLVWHQSAEALNVVVRHGGRRNDDVRFVTDAMLDSRTYHLQFYAFDMGMRLVAPRVLKRHQGAWLRLAQERLHNRVPRSLFASMLTGRIGDTFCGADGRPDADHSPTTRRPFADRTKSKKRKWVFHPYHKLFFSRVGELSFCSVSGSGVRPQVLFLFIERTVCVCIVQQGKKGKFEEQC